MAEEKEKTPLKSFLVADCGSSNTTVTLLDLADGAYRLIARASAPTTAAAPWSDLLAGLQNAINQIGEITGRNFLNERGELIRPMRKDGAGVDQFAAVVSAAAPLETVLVGLFEDVSIASARRVLQTTYAREVDTLSLMDTRSEQEQLAAILKKQPDLIFLVGGTDGGAKQRLLKLVETVALAVDLLAGVKRPQIVYAGNSTLREPVAETFGEKTNVLVAANIRPSLESEQLEEACQLISQLYDEIKVERLPGIREIREWSEYPILPTAQAFSHVIFYLAALQKGRVMGLDVGNNSVTLVSATSNKVNVAVQSNRGIGRSVSQLLQQMPPARIARWLPTETPAEEIRNYLYHRSLFPQTVPMNEAELWLEQAVIRELISCTVMDSLSALNWSSRRFFPPHRLYVLRGNALVNAPHPSQTALMFLDALQPTGLFSVAFDKQGILPALGALAAHQPLPVVQALEAGLLADIGWVVAPVGEGQKGQKVLHVKVESEEGKVELDVEYGKIERESFLLRPGKSADVTLRPGKRFDIGFGPGQGREKIRLTGGMLGLVIDARGRPLFLPTNETERQNSVRNWRMDIGG